jgi:hypothetical protein
MKASPMPISQQQLDDLFEALVAFTDTPVAEDRQRRLTRLVLMLIEHVDDASQVRAAIDQVMKSESRELVLAIP